MHNYVGLFSDQIAYLDAKDSNRNIRKLLIFTLYLLFTCFYFHIFFYHNLRQI